MWEKDENSYYGNSVYSLHGKLFDAIVYEMFAQGITFWPWQVWTKNGKELLDQGDTASLVDSQHATHLCIQNLLYADCALLNHITSYNKQD